MEDKMWWQGQSLYFQGQDKKWIFTYLSYYKFIDVKKNGHRGLSIFFKSTSTSLFTGDNFY